MPPIWLIALVAHGQIEAPQGCDVSALKDLEPPPHLAITATISAGADYHGALVMRSAERTYPTRHVSAKECKQVADALALIAELAISQLPAPAPTPAVAEPRALAPATRLSGPIYAREPPIHVSFGVSGGVASGRAPTIQPTAQPFIEAHRDLWSVRAAFLWTDRAASDLELTQLAARLEGCVFRVAAGDFEADPCLGLEIGTTRGASTDSNSGLWLAPGATLRGRWRFAHPLFAEIEGSVSVPTLRPRFLLEPDETLWLAPSVAFSGGAGLGATLW